LDPPEIGGGKGGCLVQWIATVHAPGFQRWKRSDGLPDRPWVLRVSGRHQRNVAKSGGEEDQSFSLLGDSVIRSFHNLEANVISTALQRVHKDPEDVLLGKAWNVFHRYQRRLCLENKTLKLREKIPATVGLIRLSLTVEGERLARSASGQQRMA
jgi:hypothetical protein